MVSTTHARKELKDGVLTVTFTREDKLNAVSPEMLELLGEAIAELGDDDDVKVLLITAEGRFFSAGIDIAALPSGDERTSGSDGSVSTRKLRRGYRELHLLFDELEAIEKPVVLAAQGNCFGVGIELSASCDFRLAASTAKFALPEVPNLAVIPGSGGVSRLTRLVGPSWGKWLAMAGETIDAQTALSIGLVQAVYEPDEFADRVQAFVTRLAGLPTEAVGLAKVAVDTAASVDRVTARNFDRLANTVLLTGAEHKALIQAFLDRSTNKG
jgi:enoyl-CoA hydratase